MAWKGDKPNLCIDAPLGLNESSRAPKILLRNQLIVLFPGNFGPSGEQPEHRKLAHES